MNFRAAQLQTDGRNTVAWHEWLLAGAVGMALSLGIWRALVLGGGLVGGDTYPYFMPQKQLMAEEYGRGDLPLWHDRTGLGYPLMAESQAGVLYPSNQILYRILSVTKAYSVSLLLHYWLAFVFAWRFARCQQLSLWPAMLAALVYVYGWFPARASLEWSIIGGVWLPLTLWLTDSLLNVPSRRLFVALAACLAVHLLAGHFTLAFINQLSLVLYALLWWFQGNASLPSKPREGEVSAQPPVPKDAQDGSGSADPRGGSHPHSRDGRRRRLGAVLLVPTAIACSLLLAAVQLLPTLELKRTSQREGTHQAFNPAYGHMPPLYVTQLLASWTYWHSPEILLDRQMLRDPLAIEADTNPVEAHLYSGLIPLALIAFAAMPGVRAQLPRRAFNTWAILSLLGIVYATGWLLPITRHLPGFTFFMGPARYTIVAAMGGGILSGLVLDYLLRRRAAWFRAAVTIFVAAVTLADLLEASKYVADAVIVENPPMSRLNESWLRKYFTVEDSGHFRLLAPGPNVGNLYGVSCVPTYLGLGPSFYFSDEFQLEATPTSPDETFPSQVQVARLRNLGVTHILTEDPIAAPSPEIEFVRSEPDALLNSLWHRGMKSVWLYRFKEPESRVVAVPHDATTDVKVVVSEPRHVEFDVVLKQDAAVFLRELMSPGWRVMVDGEDREAGETVFRSVGLSAGTHRVRWEYRPDSFRIGMWVSLVTAIGLLASLKRKRTAGND